MGLRGIFSGIFRGLGLLVMAVLTAGCGWEPIQPPVTPPAERVFLMYDNIGDWFDDDVEEAGAAVAAGVLGPGERVVVFHRSYRADGYTGARSVVYELVKDTSKSNGYREQMLRVYEQGENATLSREVMAAVVGDIRRAVPSPRYGLSFGSHGLGWIPRASSVTISRSAPGDVQPGPDDVPFTELWRERVNPLTRFFAGYNQKLDVSEFVDALDGEEGDRWTWDFIILDDCFMASVEALYEMRSLAGRIIASPSEIMRYGFPYDRVVRTVFADWNDMEGLGNGFIDYYANDVDDLPYGTIAVVKCDEMDALAASVRTLGLSTGQQIASVAGIQFYEAISRPGHIFYDLDDYLGRIRTEEQLVAFRQQLARTVVWKGHTASFLSDYGPGETIIPVTHFSGLNVFIPWNNTASLIDWYRATEWYKAVYVQ